MQFKISVTLNGHSKPRSNVCGREAEALTCFSDSASNGGTMSAGIRSRVGSVKTAAA